MIHRPSQGFCNDRLGQRVASASLLVLPPASLGACGYRVRRGRPLSALGFEHVGRPGRRLAVAGPDPAPLQVWGFAEPAALFGVRVALALAQSPVVFVSLVWWTQDAGRWNALCALPAQTCAVATVSRPLIVWEAPRRASAE